MIKVNLITKSMSTVEYQPVCDRMLKWLKENNIRHRALVEEWHSMPTSIMFYFGEDATAFKLRFLI